jgi:nucleoside 2-deoxyribosyltransferase
VNSYSNKGIKVYIAGPLFSDAEKAFNTKIKQVLNTLGYDSFLPQEDGILVADRLRNGETPSAVFEDVYMLDINQLKACDALLANLDGAVIDEGTAFEIGYMKALGKPCFGLQTDSRRQLPTGNNPMIELSLNHCFQTLVELREQFQSFTCGIRTSAAITTD